MVKRVLLAFVLSLSTVLLPVYSQNQVTTAEITNLNKVTQGSVISIHDPSVVLRNGVYTIWGSHLGVATSTDLVNWTPMRADNQTFRKLAKQGATTGTLCDFNTAFNIQQATRVKNYQGVEVDFPNFDAEAYCNRYDANKEGHISGNMWAPDIIWNETMQKWCMYLSCNGDNWASIIILLTSDNATGPFTYQGPIVMGGFTGQSYGDVAAPTISETDYTIATGETTLPSRYKQTDNGKFWPNCIDPCAFFDEEGELWLIYGSWSGGIFMLKLDKETGLRDYTHTYPSDYASKGASGVSDPYFGKKIAGGYYVSGEGPYIQHIGNYYYLFMSYGFFGPDGGYEMRIFRSENPEGPYVDASGNLATYTGYQMNYGTNAATNRGMKLLGSYNSWGELQNVGECAQGHNSACVDDKGRAFVVYHTKFNDGTAGHQVRVHQLFVNEKGWLVAAPFCYRGEGTTVDDIATKQYLTRDEIAGDYHLLLQKYKMDYENYEEVTPVLITLNDNGTITGDKTGTWSITEGTSYITLKIGALVYYGVVCPQNINGATTGNYRVSGHNAIAITTTSNSGVPVWAYKLEPKSAIAANYALNRETLTEGKNVSQNLKLLFPTTENTQLAWTSSNPAIISETGKVSPWLVPGESAKVALTEKISSGDYFWSNTWNLTVRSSSFVVWDFTDGLVAYYDFNQGSTTNRYNADEQVTYNRFGRTAKPTLETDAERDGNQLHLYFGAIKNNSYAAMPNPLLGADDLNGFTLSMWVKRTDNNLWDALWGFFNGTTADAAGPRLFMTGNTYVGYNDNAGTWIDVNHPANGEYNYIPVGQWTLVTMVFSKSKGSGASAALRIYANGSLQTVKTMDSNAGAITNIRNLDMTEVINKVSSLQYLYLGMGSFWGSPDCCFDDLMVYNRALSGTEISNLYKLSNMAHNFDVRSGDVNLDGKTNVADMSALIGILTGTKVSTVNADVNGDGVVDKNDLGALMMKMGMK